MPEKPQECYLLKLIILVTPNVFDYFGLLQKEMRIIRDHHSCS